MNAMLLVAVLTQFHIPDDEIGRDVVREWPELRDVATDFERVRILRHWAWGHTDFHSGGKDNPFDAQLRYVDSTSSASWYRQSAPEFYAHFAKLRGGVGHSQCAEMFAELCRHFGYRAWHVEARSPCPRQTLVEIMHRGKRLIVLQCATLNLEYVDRVSLAPLDYFELLRRLGRRQHATIKTVATPYESMPRWPRVFVPADEAGTESRLWFVAEGVAVTERLRHGDLLVHSPRTLDGYLRKRLYDRDSGEAARMRDFVAGGYPPHHLYGHVQHVGIFTLSNDVNMERRAVAAIALGEGERLELSGRN